MNVAEIMEQRNAFSFEVFPPKTDVGMEKLCGEGGVLEKLYTLNPDYISCTYGGTNVGKNLEVLKKIKADGKCTPVTHFTCVANTKEGIKDQLQTYLDNGIDHMLALRGDIPFGWTGTNGDLHYATELVKFVRKEFGDKFTIAVAGSPEGHIACRSLEADISFLKQKQDEGADYIMTQLCWDMDQFRYWMDAIRAAGICSRRCRYHQHGALPQRLRDVPRPVRDHLQALDLPESVRSERVRGVHRCQEGVL
jgi:methylenetetrahydrofolate reductase (NADPH)